LINITLDFLPTFRRDFANTIEIPKVFHPLADLGYWSTQRDSTIKKLLWSEKNNLKIGKTGNDWRV